MFTLQISQAANQLKEAGLSDQAVDVLMQMLGNCQDTLVHRGPITVNADFPEASYNVGDAPVIQTGNNYPAAPLTTNSDGVYDPNTNKVNGGLAAVFNGPVYIGGPILGPGGAPVRLAKAQSNWEQSLPGVSLVAVRETTSIGGLTEVGPVFNLYLPHTTPGDPNVVAGAVLAYGLHNNVAVCLSPYMDDKIGTVKLWALASGSVPAGWAVMDGTSNATVGSGYDMRSRFARGVPNAGAVGTTGGSTSYTPEGEVSGSISGTFDTSSETVNYSGTTDTYTYVGTTSLDLELDLSTLESDEFAHAPHAHHHHHYEYSTINVTGDAGGIGVNSVTGSSHLAPTLNTSDGYTSNDDTYTWEEHDPIRATFTESSAYETTADVDLSAWSHAHTYSGTTDSHYHTVEIDASGFEFTGTEATIIPPFRDLFYIERINNSL